MKKSIRLTSVFLSLLLAFSAVACGEAAGTPSGADDTSAADIAASETTVDPNSVSDLPASFDLGGYTLRVARQEQEAIKWALNTFAPESENGEVLNDAFFRRNLTVGEKYNFSIEETITSADPFNDVNKSIMAGDDVYDLMLSVLSNTGKAYTGNFMDFNEIPNINLGKNYWDKNVIRDLTIGGKICVMNGDIMLSNNDTTYITMYNRALAEDFKIENLYEVTRAGNWTLDKMKECMRVVAADLNADGVNDEKDRYGLLFVDNAAVEPYFAGSGAYLYEAPKKDDPYFGFVGDSERAYQVFEKYNEVISDKTQCFDWSFFGTDTAAVINLIQNKQVLFQTAVLSFARRNYRDITIEIGLLPLAKLDEKQDKYYGYRSLSSPYMFVPVTAGDPEKLGFVLEALGSESSDIIDAYYHTCMESKYARDEESIEMMYIADENIVYDAGFVYNWGGLGANIRKAVMQADSGYASLLASGKDASIAAMKKMIDELGD